MYDPTFHVKTLERELRLADFIEDHNLFDQTYRDLLVQRAENRAKQGFAATALKKSKIRSENVYQFARLEDELVARKIVRNIRRITKVRQSDRNIIVSCIDSICRDGLPLRIYKLDVKNFYESVPVEIITSRLQDDIAFSKISTYLVGSLFSELKAQNINGLPRGLSISATLSEYLMRAFDIAVSRLPNVCYYSRFVDDIIFITHGFEDKKEFIENIKNKLPIGLELNSKKTNTFDFSEFSKSSKDVLEGQFDFLGYTFFINHAVRNKANTIIRGVRIDISEKKVKKIKTRIIRAALRFIADNNFSNFEDRVKMLSSNYKFLDIDKKSFRKAGIYFNYEKVNLEKSESLPGLDRFLKKFMLAKNGPIGSQLNLLLSPSQRKALLRYSFKKGFERKIFFDFNGMRLSELKSCWRYA